MAWMRPGEWDGVGCHHGAALWGGVESRGSLPGRYGRLVRSGRDEFWKNRRGRCSAEEHDEEIQVPFVFLVRGP